MERTLTLRPITARVLQKIVKFMIETGTEDILGKLLFETQLPDITWAELRQRADLTAKELKELQAKYEDPRVATLNVEKEKGIQIISQDVVTIKDLYKDVMHLIGDDVKWEKLVEILAYLYEIEAQEIEEMTLKEIMELVNGLIKDSNFTEALS